MYGSSYGYVLLSDNVWGPYQSSSYLAAPRLLPLIFFGGVGQHEISDT